VYGVGHVAHAASGRNVTNSHTHPPKEVSTTSAGEVSRGEKMLYSGTDPESYITEYTLVYEDYKRSFINKRSGPVRLEWQRGARAGLYLLIADVTV